MQWVPADRQLWNIQSLFVTHAEMQESLLIRYLFKQAINHEAARKSALLNILAILYHEPQLPLYSEQLWKSSDGTENAQWMQFGHGESRQDCTKKITTTIVTPQRIKWVPDMSIIILCDCSTTSNMTCREYWKWLLVDWHTQKPQIQPKPSSFYLCPSKNRNSLKCYATI